MIDYPHLAQRLFNTPLALHPAKAEVVMAALADRFGLARLFRPSGEAVALSSFDLEAEEEGAWKPYEVIAGVAIVPISGTLVQKLGTLRPFSGMTGYDGIRANLGMALEDESVRAIVLDVDSPGGEVAGCFDLVDWIVERRGEKPLAAILSENAYSAAFAIATAADPGRLFVPRTGGTGSVGVIALHVAFERALDRDGIDVTMFTYGKHKGEGSELKTLSKEAAARFQADVDAMGELFVETVARNRNLAVAKVRATEAGTFLGAQGVEIGFADAVKAPSQAFAALLEELG